MSLMQRLLTIWLSLALLVAGSLAAASEYVTYLHPDVQGSPVVATNEQGQVVWRESYAPWGEREIKDRASANVVMGSSTWYTGKEEEEALGLYYYGARWYSPDIGQFYSIDPAPVALSNPRSFGRYLYANNNPIRYVDPDGRSAVAWANGGFTLDVSSPEPTDVAWPKWLGWGVVFAGAYLLDQVMNESAEGSDAASDGGQDLESGKARNKPPEPLKEAEGRPHSIIETPGSEGQYTTHNGDGTLKQYRGSGKDHGNTPRPNVKVVGKNRTPEGREFIDKGRVRPARPDEIPMGRK